ncbi:MAG: hypothetical protein WCG25_03035 [bacterium]
MKIKDLMVNHIQEILDLDDIKEKVIIEKQVVDMETKNIVDRLIRNMVELLIRKNMVALQIKNILRVIKYN